VKIASVLLLLGAAVLVSACATRSARESAQTETHPSAHTFGADLPGWDRSTDIGSAIAGFQKAGAPAVYRGKVTKVCQAKGCWLVIAAGDQFARVETGHKFFVPKDLSGEALVYGILDRAKVDDERAAHLREDGLEETGEFQIQAFAVRIP
jgi:Domain of unknown function (DUF4920)